MMRCPNFNLLGNKGVPFFKPFQKKLL